MCIHSLSEKRDNKLTIISENYNFGRMVESMSGFEYIGGEKEYSRKVFLESAILDDDTGEPVTEMVYLTVVFEENSDKVRDAYAIDKKGNIFGEMDIDLLN